MGIVNYPCVVLNIRGNEPIVTNYECYSLHTFHRHLNLLNINFPLQLVARQYNFPSCFILILWFQCVSVCVCVRERFCMCVCKRKREGERLEQHFNEDRYGMVNNESILIYLKKKIVTRKHQFVKAR